MAITIPHQQQQQARMKRARRSFNLLPNSLIWCFGAFLLGYMTGNRNKIWTTLSPTEKNQAAEAESKQNATTKKRPLQIFPLLKDLKCGWYVSE